MIYDQDNPEQESDAIQCDMDIGKIFYRQCPDVATTVIIGKTSGKVYTFCDDHAEMVIFDD